MRRRLPLAVLAVTLGLFALSTPSIESQPKKPTKTKAAKDIERYAKLQAELNKRQLLDQVLRRRPDLDSATVARQLGAESDPDLAGLSIDSLRLEQDEIHGDQVGRGIGLVVQRDPGITAHTVSGEDDTMNVARSASQSGQGVPPSPPPPPQNVRPTVVDPAILDVARAVVAIVDRKALREDNGRWVLTVDSLTVVEGGYRLCEEDRDYGCPSAKVAGTGFLVADTVIATAGHIVSMDRGRYEQFLDSVYILFDYQWGPAGAPPETVFTADQVYRGTSVLIRRLDAQVDLALIQLDRAVTGNRALKYRTQGKVPEGARVYMIGHPNGLPQRLAPNAHVLDNTACSYFLADLDTWPYNSGSPVFNAVSHEVEGILVRDIAAYEKVCGCATTAKWRPQLGRPGVDVVRSTEFAGFLSNPDSVFVRFRATVSPLAVLIAAPGDTAVFTRGEERFVPFNGPGLQLVVTPNCTYRYYPERGSVWDIVDADVLGLTRMQKACFP